MIATTTSKTTLGTSFHYGEMRALGPAGPSLCSTACLTEWRALRSSKSKERR
jgi:hypothetical protein